RQGLMAMQQDDHKKLWLTYAWKDNKNEDVDYYVQLLEDAGLEVHIDRWDIAAGQRLWPQIADAITNPEKSDAWGFIVSKASLQSERCQEELSYALGRALDERRDQYPLIGIIIEKIDDDLPPALSVRLWVSVEDSDWVERVHQGAHGRGLGRRQRE